MKMRFKKLLTTAGIPSRGSEKAAGYDLYIDSLEPTVQQESCICATSTVT